MAKKQTSSAHLDEGIKQLKEAMTEAKNGYLDEAVEAREDHRWHMWRSL